MVYVQRLSTSSDDAAPRYRIRAVALLTGVATATLRAWERRYGVPEPARSDKRYRLYSERDVALIRRMAALCASGLRPAEAARTARFQGLPPREADGTGSDGGLVDRVVEAVSSMDLDALRAALERAFATGSAARVFDTVIAPAMHRVGELWARGEISVAAEHAASFVVRETLSNFLRLGTPPDPAPTVVLGCFDEEQHELGLLGFALHLAAWGYRPIFLGMRVPATALRDAVARHRPCLVAISAVIEPQVDARAVLSGYARACGDVPWIVGGASASLLAEQVHRRGGHVAPGSTAEVRALVDRLCRGKGRVRRKARGGAT